MTRTRKISNPSIHIAAEGSRVKFKINTLLFYSKECKLGKLEGDVQTREVPKGAKIDVEKTIYRSKDETFISRTSNNIWFEWTEDEAVLL
jgi:hypothetical protein